MGWFKRKTASRKYVDLLNETSSKWANWDPPVLIKAGDFGSIDRKSGRFVCDGNIYSESEMAAITKPFPVDQRSQEDTIIIMSHRARSIEQGAEPHISVPGIADATISIKFQLEKERGAFLIMHGVRMTVVPDQLLKRLEDNLFLKGKCLVTQVFSCDGYVLYLSDGSEHAVSVTLDASAVAAAAALPVTAGAGVKTAWHIQGHQGFFRRAYSKGGHFAPLYDLRSLRKPLGGRRDLPKEIDNDEHWLEVDIPWEELDDDGQESGDDEDEDEDEEGESDQMSE